MPKDRVSNEHQGYGFVEFRSEEDADYAIKVGMNGGWRGLARCHAHAVPQHSTPCLEDGGLLHGRLHLPKSAPLPACLPAAPGPHPPHAPALALTLVCRS